MPINDILANFSNLTPRGRGYTADCPLHPGRPTALRIYPEFGNYVLDCPNGCPDHQIAAAVGINLTDLFDLDDDDQDNDDVYEEEDDDEIEEPPAQKTRELQPGEIYGFYGDILRTNAFDVKSATQWLDASAARPRLNKLFGEFWLEGELSIMFADTGRGKSILAVQIAESLARGVGLAPFRLKRAGEKVLYYDFELSEKMFEQRYSTSPGKGHYPFSPNFLRAQLCFNDYIGDETWAQYLHTSFDQILRSTEARILIVDNITFLSSNEQAGRAMKLMQAFRIFKEEYKLSILLLAHTPKRRFSRGLNVNDLQGSKMLSNFADNIFAIGDSCLGPDIRYLKQIKPRNTELIYGASNVCTYRIAKRDNFLGFWFTGYSEEREHLENQLVSKEADRRILNGKVKALRADGLSIRKIADLLGISKSSANRILTDDQG